MPNTRATKDRVCSVPISKPRWNFPIPKMTAQKTSSEIPIKTSAIVNEPIRHALGFRDARTLSVVNDMPRRSPVSIIMTINMGVRIACPVSKIICFNFIVQKERRIREDFFAKTHYIDWKVFLQILKITKLRCLRTSSSISFLDPFFALAIRRRSSIREIRGYLCIIGR